MDTIESLTRVAGALSLLGSLKMTGGGWRRARKRLTQLTSPGARKARDPRSASHLKTPSKRQRAWIDTALTGLWIALLLSVVGYATVKGEAAMAELDGLDLVTIYSLEP